MGKWIDETQDEIFDKLNSRIFDAINSTDLNAIFNTLKTIDKPTLVTGVGGSEVVARFTAKVLNKKNKIIAIEKTARDLLTFDLSGFNNVISCSYSGNNAGVDASFSNDLTKYLFSGNKKEGIIPLQYVVNDEECSFCSVAGTFIPMAIGFLYYTDNNFELLKEILNSKFEFEVDDKCNDYEVIVGGESETAALLLDSTFVEGSLAHITIHEKYNYAHGRCMLNCSFPADVIYFSGDSDYDNLLKDNLESYYQKVICFERKYQDDVIDDFYQCLKALNLCKRIAEGKGKDISLKRVPDFSEIMYTFKGKIK